MVGAPVRPPVARQVDRDRGTPEREHQRVPRVGVLPAAVEEDELGIAVTPHEHADELVGRHLEVPTNGGEARRPGQADLVGVLGEHRELVVGRGVDGCW